MPADKCDYKLRSVTEKGKTVTVNITIYEGEISTLDENLGDGPEPVTRYRRSGEIEQRTIVFDRPIAMQAIHGNLRNILKEVQNRTPIEEQS